MQYLIDMPETVKPEQGNNEWYTPARYIEAARRVMAGIDLDPASCELANRTVKATRYYTKDDDGLKQDWTCFSMWLNPPFGTTITPFDGSPWQGTSTTRLFVRKLLEDYSRGIVQQCVLLAKADPKQNWFHALWDYPICFAYDKVYFNRPNGPPQRIQFGTCFVYLGPNEQAFIEEFSAFGTIAKRVSTPRKTIAPLSLWEAEEDLCPQTTQEQ